jgi:hypothetical protein
MKTPLLIVLTVIVLGTGSVLAIMNNSCKSSHHAWCAPISDIRHHAKIGHARRVARWLATGSPVASQYTVVCITQDNELIGILRAERVV